MLDGPCKNESDENQTHNPSQTSTMEKFKMYRTVAESNEVKLKEAQLVIDQLKEEINISKEMEKNWKNEIESSQKRSIQLRENLKKSVIIFEKQLENEKISKAIEEKINDLNVAITEIQDKSKKIFNTSSNEIILMKMNDKLKEILKAKESEFDLMNMKLHTLTEEKTELENRWKEKIKNLHEELEKSKCENQQIKNQYEKNLTLYKKQIEDGEQLIKKYETERQSLLEEFELPNERKNTEDNTVTLKWADSTVTINSEKSMPMECTNWNDEFEILIPTKSTVQTKQDNLFQGTTSTKVKSKSCRTTSQPLPRAETRQKPELSFLTSTQHPTDRISSEVPIKRRLFSTNCNHYLN